MVVLEALAQGTPVVTTQNTPWQSLETTQAGFWIKNDVEALQKALIDYFEFPVHIRTSMKINAKNLATKFKADKILKKYLDIYQSVLKSTNSKGT